MPTPAIQKCIDAACAVGFRFPHFLIVHSKIRDLYREDPSLPTMAIDANGRIIINPTFVNSLPKDQLGGCVCHEMLHLALDYFGRLGSKDRNLWNIAHDMAINSALRKDGIALPSFAVYPPLEYRGDLNAESIYEWLLTQARQQSSGQGKPGDGSGRQMQGGQPGQSGSNGQGQVTGGCGVNPAPKAPSQQGQGQGQGQHLQQTAPQDFGQVWQGARVVAQSMIGEGSSQVLQLIRPVPARIDWRKVLRSGFQLVATRQDKVAQTYSRRHRRSPAEGAQFPGWVGGDPTIAILIDVSGSMSREWIEEIVAECKKLAQLYRGTKAFLATHTDHVTWEGWINGTSQIDTSVQFTGGTNAHPAYESARKAGHFDALIHFTDCELPGSWPTPPARRLIVGAYGSGATNPYCHPPPGATLIPCGRD